MNVRILSDDLEMRFRKSAFARKPFSLIVTKIILQFKFYLTQGSQDLNISHILFSLRLSSCFINHSSSFV